ncbi:enhanced intracellular survival protein Eis [Rhodococcus triatomae]|uniref:Predicted acetyltransferase n=1 Tax=Rhodococcus triatomae TaxID=300028 RepID=A0A1G8QUS5_9NOCA|nr:enhanced intracellular survival protein Eis [Rhodococcus triatomae]QNG20779.1 enhanced intracellular survival protein Eis [Rhodococcus triatomae]QNG23305.1 enhanced intracellular survival protein Eis [Rhodococcus triatomae]SDJ08482.1 Predicted acetyltransferase [Rhodococcus triatomae]
MSTPAPTVRTAVDVRTATDSDWPAVELIDSVGFGYHPVEADLTLARTLTRTEDVVLATAEDVPVGVAMDLGFDLTVPGGAQLPTRGVTWVSVVPTHRRRGALRALLTELHTKIAATGAPLAALTASEAGIYGRFGYGPATVLDTVRFDRRFARFRDSTPDPGGVFIADAKSAAERLPGIYDRWRRLVPGAQSRPQAHWDHTFADPEAHREGASALFFLVHPDGYATFRRAGGSGGKEAATVVDELVAVTPDAHIALWRALCGLDLTVTIEAHLHADDPLRLQLTDYRLVRTTGRADDLWLRIMDVPAALEARTYAADLETVIEIRDPFLDAGGTYALTVRDGRAQCRRTDATARVSTDIDVLGSLYLGGHRARTFAAANRLSAADPAEVAALDIAFGAERPAVLGWGF